MQADARGRGFRQFRRYLKDIGFLRLPAEIKILIAGYAAESTCEESFREYKPRRVPIATRGHPAFIPPSDGSSPFLALPTEIRKAIFTESLSSKHCIAQPKCDDDVVGNVGKVEGKAEHTKDNKLSPRKRNRASDLMTINRTIKDEIALILYEERDFAIHVHEGIRDGGIEFLNTGRQPLQYQDETIDSRFARFTCDGDFSFHRLKRIHVTIYPSENVDNSRHAVLNTYFMNLALCRLLKGSGGQGNRITSIEINFATKPIAEKLKLTGRRAMMMRENYWWDVDTKKPRETSIHGLSNIELVLRPFATLLGCHIVKVHLPEKIDKDEKALDFVENLTVHMKSLQPLEDDFFHDRVAQQIEAARPALEDHILHELYGVHDKFFVAPLTAEELEEGYGEDDGVTI